MGLPIVTLGTMGVEMGEGEAITTVGAVGVTDDVSGSPIGTSTMRGSVDGPCRWVEEKRGSKDNVCWIGGRGAGVDKSLGPVFVLGGRIFFRAIRLPNTTRASPIWRSVPLIEIWRSSFEPLATEKALTQAPEISWICLRLFPPCIKKI